MRFIKYFVIIGVFLAFFSCKKKDKAPLTSLPETGLKNGILVLNEGLFNQNNSTLNWIDLTKETVSEDLFLEINGRLLGDVANAMLLYGGKIYIVVTTSSTVEVVDKKTLKSLAQIPFHYQNKSQQPRQIVGKGKSVFVTSFDGYVSEIDTTNLKITNRLKVGKNPEGICAVDDFIYVSNSGGLDAPNYDSTVYKINVSTLEVVDTFIIGNNPGNLLNDDFGNIYVVKSGDYMETSELMKIEISTGNVSSLGIPATTLSIRNNMLYISSYDFNSGKSTVSVFNCAEQTVEKADYISSSNFTTLYNVIPFRESDVICLDVMNYVHSGYVKIFSENGQLKKSYQVDLNPNSIIYYE